VREIKNNKGITIIALVVTIIIILILSIITINSIFDQDGIFDQAEETKDMTANEMAFQQERMNQLVQGYINTMGGDTSLGGDL